MKVFIAVLWLVLGSIFYFHSKKTGKNNDVWMAVAFVNSSIWSVF